MQYLYENLWMHIICGIKMQYLHYDSNPHYIWGKKMQYLHDNLWMHIVSGSKMQYSHYDPYPHYLREAKMLNPYIKHETFLVKFDDRVKTIQGD